MSNANNYPEAWKVFEKNARNIEGFEDEKFGKYAIHHPFKSEWIYSNCPGELFMKFKDEFYKPDAKSPSVYGRIQYIVEHLR